MPVPQAKDLEELNAQLLEGCLHDQQRQIAGHEVPVGAAMLIERDHLLPLAEEDFDLAEASFPTVDGLGCVKVRTNFYSVPLRPGTVVEARIHSAYVEIWHQGRRVACHERSYSRQQQILDLEHYLDVLERKPGALSGSKPLAQARQQGHWPESFDRFWQQLMARHGKQAGTRQMIELLAEVRQHGWKGLRDAVEAALTMGSSDVAAVRYLLANQRAERVVPAAIEVGLLERYERPLPVMTDYDRLLGAEVEL